MGLADTTSGGPWLPAGRGEAITTTSKVRGSIGSRTQPIASCDGGLGL